MQTPVESGQVSMTRCEAGTSAANSVRISPIAFKPTRKVIWGKPKLGKTRAMNTKLSPIVYLPQTFEKRLFSIFWAMASFKASGRVRSRIFLCLNFTTSVHISEIMKVYPHKPLTPDLLSFIVYHELKPLPFSHFEHSGNVKPGGYRVFFRK